MRALAPLPLSILLAACPGDDASPTSSGSTSTSTGSSSDSGETTSSPMTAADSSTGPTGTTDAGTTGSTTSTEPTGTTDSDTEATADSDTTAGGVDQDMDGVPEGLDCDDEDPLQYPGAPERCNGEDDDCDPATDEDGVVSVDGEGSYGSVADAVAAAAPGSTLRVCPGTYVETVTLTDSIQITSRDGAATTIIDANNGGPTVTVMGGTVELSGLTLTGGSSMALGGGLSILGTDPVTLSEMVITDNQSTDGAGIYTYSGAQLTIDQSTITDNLGEIGGGLMFQGSTLTITNSVVAQNIATEVGGGMVIFGLPTVQIDSTSIIDNQSLDGGGLAVEAASFTLGSSVIERNTATSLGGGLFLFFGSPAVVTSFESDWGTGSDDNVPHDVFVGGLGAFTGYGANESFSCSAAGCL